MVAQGNVRRCRGKRTEPDASPRTRRTIEQRPRSGYKSFPWKVEFKSPTGETFDTAEDVLNAISSKDDADADDENRKRRTNPQGISFPRSSHGGSGRRLPGVKEHGLEQDVEIFTSRVVVCFRRSRARVVAGQVETVRSGNGRVRTKSRATRASRERVRGELRRRGDA